MLKDYSDKKFYVNYLSLRLAVAEQFYKRFFNLELIISIKKKIKQ